MRITSYEPDGSQDDLAGLSLDDGTSTPWSVYLFAVVIAFLTLPGTASVSMGNTASVSKTVVVETTLPLGFLKRQDRAAPVDRLFCVAGCDLFVDHDLFTLIGDDSFRRIFSICLFGLRWRCWISASAVRLLRRVAHPAQVGYSSRAFLAWNGTELICVSGHTMLQIPDLPTSWFSTQRWLYLDTPGRFCSPIQAAMKDDLLLRAVTWPHYCSCFPPARQPTIQRRAGYRHALLE